MFSSHTTLLFIGRDRLVRADFDARGKRTGSWQRQRPMSAELPELIDTASRQASARLGRTWVLAEDFWTQRLSVGHEMVSGLSPAEAARMLAFEAESLSGQSAVDSDIGSVRLPGSRERDDFWVVQIPHWVRDQAETSIRSHGGRLAGMIHPGGLPTYLAGFDSQVTGWGRIETWTGVTVAVGQTADGALLTTLATGDNRTTGWQRAIETWLTALGETATIQQMYEVRQTLPISRTMTAVDLNDQHAFDVWLGSWAAYLLRSQPAIPLVVPPKQPIAQSTFIAAGVGLAVVVGAISLADNYLVRSELTSLKAEVAKRVENDQKIKQEQANVKKETEELNRKLTAAKPLVAKLEVEVPRTTLALWMYRDRWAELLSILAETCPEDIVVQEITSDGAGLTLHGASLGVEPLNKFTVELGRRLAPHGWNVTPDYELDLANLNRAELFKFKLILKDEPLRPAPVADNTFITATREENDE